MWYEILTSIPFIFLVSTLVVLLLFRIGKVISAKGKKTPGKLASYSCGEDLPPIKIQVNVRRFFIYGLCFLIFDAVAFLLFLSFGQPGVYPVIFSVIALLIVVIIIPLEW